MFACYIKHLIQSVSNKLNRLLASLTLMSSGTILAAFIFSMNRDIEILLIFCFIEVRIFPAQCHQEKSTSLVCSNYTSWAQSVIGE